MINPCGWICDPFHHDSLVSDLHQSIEPTWNTKDLTVMVVLEYKTHTSLWHILTIVEITHIHFTSG